MELRDFIGKVVINSKTNARYLLSEITAPVIKVVTEKPNENGYCRCYHYPTVNGDPITNGTLVFEDNSLTTYFKNAYESYCNSEDGRLEEYGYWMMRD